MRRSIVSLAICALFACQRAEAPKAEGPEAATPKPIRVADDRTDLVYTYAEKGQYKTAQRAADVPEPAKKQVVVTDLSLSPAERQAGRYIYLADLSEKAEDGSYRVAIASRYGFEAKLAASSTVAGGPGEKGVVLYSASWCGVCKQAKRLLTAWKVPFVEKDIEASKSASEELAKKARAAGVEPRGVPVIDVAGTLLLGLDEGSLKQALKQRGLL